MNSRILNFDKFKIQLFFAMILASTLLFTCTSEPEIKKPIVKSLKGETWSGGKMVLLGANFGSKFKPSLRVGNREVKVMSFSDTEISFEVPYGQFGKLYITKNKKTYATRHVIQSNPDLPMVYSQKIDSLKNDMKVVLDGDNFGVDISAYKIYVYDTENVEHEGMVESVSNKMFTFKIVSDSNVVLVPKFKIIKKEQSLVFNMPDFQVKTFNFLKLLDNQAIQQNNLHTVFDTQNVAISQDDIFVFIDNVLAKNLDYVDKELVSSQSQPISDNPSVVFYVNDTFYPPINPKNIVQWTDAALWQTDLIERVGMKNPGEIKSLALKLHSHTLKTKIDQEQYKISINFPVAWIKAKDIKSNFVFGEGTVLSTDLNNFDWVNPQKIVIVGEDGQEIEYDYQPKIVGSNKVIHFDLEIGGKKHKAKINHSNSSITLSLPVTTLNSGEAKANIKLAAGARINGQKFPLNEWRKPNELEVISVNGKSKNYSIVITPEGDNQIESMYINTYEGEVVVDSIDDVNNTIVAYLPQHFITEGEDINVSLEVSPEAMYETPKLTRDHLGDYTSDIKITSIDGKERQYKFKGEVLDNIFNEFNLIGKLYVYKGHIDNANNTIQFYVNINEDLSLLKSDFSISDDATVDFDISSIKDWSSDFEFTVKSAFGKERTYTVQTITTVMLHEDIKLTSQKQIDRFAKAQFQGVVGNLSIEGNNITSLKPLDGIKRVNGDLNVNNTLNLESLEGLHNLDTVTGNMSIENNISLTDLKGLDKLSVVQGQFYVGYNSYLKSLNGISSLNTVEKGINIRGNDILKDISALSSLTTLKGDNRIGFNDELESVFETQTDVVEGNLNMMFNDQLSDISGFSSVQHITGDFILAFNPKLADINGMVSLTHIGQKFILHGMTGFQNLNSLKPLDSIGNHLSIRYNEQLEDISALLKFNFANKKLRISDNASLKGIEEYKKLFESHNPSVLSVLHNGWKQDITEDIDVEGSLVKTENSESETLKAQSMSDPSSSVEDTMKESKDTMKAESTENTTGDEVTKTENAQVDNLTTPEKQFADGTSPEASVVPTLDNDLKKKKQTSVLDHLTKIDLKPFQKKIIHRKAVLYLNQEDYNELIRSYNVHNKYHSKSYLQLIKEQNDDVFYEGPQAIEGHMLDDEEFGDVDFEESKENNDSFEDVDINEFSDIDTLYIKPQTNAPIK